MVAHKTGRRQCTPKRSRAQLESAPARTWKALDARTWKALELQFFWL
ncbi:hypothetical protein [Methylocystis echinoides]